MHASALKPVALLVLTHGLEVLGLVQKRQGILKDAWLTASGHRRPGMPQGLKLPEAERQARDIEARIVRLLPSVP